MITALKKMFAFQKQNLKYSLTYTHLLFKSVFVISHKHKVFLQILSGAENNCLKMDDIGPINLHKDQAHKNY